MARAKKETSKVAPAKKASGKKGKRGRKQRELGKVKRGDSLWGKIYKLMDKRVKEVRSKGKDGKTIIKRKVVKPMTKKERELRKTAKGKMLLTEKGKAISKGLKKVTTRKKPRPSPWTTRKKLYGDQKKNSGKKAAKK